MGKTRSFRVAAGAAFGGAGLVLALAGPAGAQVDPLDQLDPGGNNGTVKIDGVDFDDHPNNEPHVGCEFQVDFYGFDADTAEDDLSASVLFEAIPPTVSPDTMPPGAGEELLTDELDIGEDAAGGGTDLDASGTYDLTEALAHIAPHPEQGWHVKLTVHADGSQGADTKFKVFWVSGCGETTTTSSSTTTTTKQETTTTTAPGSTTSSSTTSSVPGGTTPSTSAPPSSASPSAPTTTPAGAEGDLPRTGSDTVPLLVGALALIALGVGGVFGAKHLRSATRH
jgi:hypothetical protein